MIWKNTENKWKRWEMDLRRYRVPFKPLAVIILYMLCFSLLQTVWIHIDFHGLPYPYYMIYCWIYFRVSCHIVINVIIIVSLHHHFITFLIIRAILFTFEKFNTSKAIVRESCIEHSILVEFVWSNCMTNFDHAIDQLTMQCCVYYMWQ